MFIIVAVIAALGAGLIGVRAVIGYPDGAAPQTAPGPQPATTQPPPNPNAPAPSQGS